MRPSLGVQGEFYSNGGLCDRPACCPSWGASNPVGFGELSRGR